MPTQPWVYSANPLGYLWARDLVEAIENKFIDYDYVRDHVERGFVRPSLLYQIENGTIDGLLLPRAGKHRRLAMGGQKVLGKGRYQEHVPAIGYEFSELQAGEQAALTSAVPPIFSVARDSADALQSVPESITHLLALLCLVRRKHSEVNKGKTQLQQVGQLPYHWHVVALL